MKSTNFFSVIMLFAIAIESYSNPVDIETAKSVAQNFMNKRGNTSKMVSDVVTEQFEGHNSFYVVNFHEGGWVMVSADNSTVPALAFSLDGAYRAEDEKPDGFLYLIEDYKEQVDVARKMQSSRSNEVIEMWNQLMFDVDNDNSDISRQSITPETRDYSSGQILLNVPGRGHIAWGQSINNDDDCTPSYNGKIEKKWWHGWFSSCSDDCDKPPAGCGAVAMGQLMWFWQWPKSSTYRTYNWNLMPNILNNASTTAQGNAIGNLLLDCGRASSMTYACEGSFTTNIEPALKNRFSYKGTRTVYRSDWQSNSSVWNDIIRTEIDCERPVIMYGANANTINKRHYFIIDGYDTNDHYYFHINFGWRGNHDDYFYLNNINPNGKYFSDNQYAIIGISPTYSTSVNISDVSYTNVTDFRLEAAQQNINLPATGKNLTVEVEGDLTLYAGNSIILGHGFHAKPGSQFTAKIEDLASKMEIENPSLLWMYGELFFVVDNANSYDFTVKNGSGTTVYQSADVMPWYGGIFLWDGSSFPSDNYTFSIRVRNNYGRAGYYTASVFKGRNIIEQLEVFDMLDDNVLTAADVNDLEDGVSDDDFLENEIQNFSFTIFPNPTSGFVTVDYTLYVAAPICIELYNVFGQRLKLITPTQNHEAGDYRIQTSVSDLSSGTYLIKVISGNQVETKQVIINP